VAHLKKYLQSNKDFEPEAVTYVESTIELFKNISELMQGNKEKVES
jgi:hypothetical protein